MKRVLALLYFGVLAMGSIYAQGIEFFHGTYEEALQKARAEGKQIFVDVYTSWCGPCKMLAPMLEKLSEEMTQVSIVSVDVDEEQEVAMKYSIFSVPTMLIFKDGKKVDQLVGLMPQSQIREKLEYFAQ